MAEPSSRVQGLLAAEKNIPHGTFNSLATHKNPKKHLYDQTEFDPFASIKEELTKKYTPDVFDMKAEWNAIVLKVIEPDNALNVLDPIYSALGSLIADPESSAKKDVCKFIGRVPEMHGCLLLPEGPEDSLVLSMYPIFEGAAALGKPKEGDIVRVTFDNLNNFSGPKYIGPLTSPSAISGLGNAQEVGAREAFTVNSPRSSRTSVPNLSDLNNDPNRVGHAVNAGSFPRTLITIDTAKLKFPHTLYNRALARGFGTDLVPVSQINTEQHINIYISVAAAEVIEQYWRQQFADATVMIIFNTRNRSERDRANSHGIGAAIDFTVHTGGTTVPVLQTWTALTRLGKAGRIPLGGRGVYLNTSPNGIKGISPEECGEASPGQGKAKDQLPQGGSAGIHYDWRDSFGNQRGPRGGKPNTWISTDVDGDGHDEYELGESNTRLGTDDTYVYTYLQAALPDVLRYWRAQGSGDNTLPAVGSKVFNLLQVLEIEQ